MKKILLVIAVLFAAVAADAQIKFGVKGGMNITEMSFSKDVLKSDNQTGFFVGPMVRFDLPLIGLGVDASALYDQRSYKLSESSEVNGVNEFKQKQIIIPVNARYQLGPDLFGVFVYTGPQVAFNIGDENVKDAASEWTFRSSTLSWNFGAGLMVAKHLEAKANYNVPLGKTGEYTVTYNNIKEAAEGKSKTWQISLGYYF